MKRLLFFLALLFCFARTTYAQPVAASQPDTTKPLSPLLSEMVEAVDNIQAQDSCEASQLLLLPYRAEILAAAHKHRLPPSLIAGVIQQESVWDQWAEKTEPAYLKKRIVQSAARTWSRDHRGLPSYQTELQDRSRSMGLMQPMGQLAREQGFKERYLSSLFIPTFSIDQGATLLKKLLVKYHNDTSAAISAYNQGNARKRHGSFVNARYVYRVHVGWEAWKHVYGEDTNSTTSGAEAKANAHSNLHRSAVHRDHDRERVLETSFDPNVEADVIDGTFNTESSRLRDSIRHEFAGAIPNDGTGELALRYELERRNQQTIDAGQHGDAIGVWIVGVALLIVLGYGAAEYRRQDSRSRYAESLPRHHNGLV